METPLISIISVVRNDPDGLSATRASLTAQQWQGFEWRVADGGSQDGTLARLAGPGRQPDWLDSRPDGGPFAGMDRAADGARGGYLLFLNAGDCLADPMVLADLVPVLRTKAPDLLYGDSLEDPGDGRIRRKPARHWRWCFYGMPAHHCAILYRRAGITGQKLDQGYRIAGDYAFTLAVIRRARRVYQTNRVIARFAPGGLSRRHAALGRQEQAAIRREVLGLPQILSIGINLLHIVAYSCRTLCPRGYAFWRFKVDCE